MMSFRLLILLLLVACDNGTTVIERIYTNEVPVEVPVEVVREDVIEVIDPCGTETTFDEVILRLADGSLIAYFQLSGNEFLVRLPPGDYITTDGTECHFTVTHTMEVI